MHWIVKFVLGRRGSSGNVDVNGLRTVFKVLLAKMNRRYTSNMQKRATAAATVGKAGSAGPARKKKKEEQEEELAMVSPGRLSAHQVSHSRSSLYGAFV